MNKDLVVLGFLGLTTFNIFSLKSEHDPDEPIKNPNTIILIMHSITTEGSASLVAGPISFIKLNY